MTSSLRSLTELYRDAAPSLLAFFRRHRPLATEAEDLLHDTFVRAMRRPERLAASVTPRAYLFGIARHIALDALRRRRVPADEAIALFSEPRAADDPRLEMLRTAITHLSDAHREPLLLKLQQELSYEEIAEVLDLPVGTIRSRLHYAVARLKEELNPSAAATPTARPAAQF